MSIYGKSRDPWYHLWLQLQKGQVPFADKTRFHLRKEYVQSVATMFMAAAAVYLALQDNNEKVSQTTIAQISGISAVTIRNRVKEIEIAQVK